MKTHEQSDAAIIESLIGELGDPQKSVQRRAIDRLVELAAAGNTTVAERLRDSMASADRRVRWASAYALAQIGAGAFAMDSADALAEAMADDDGDIRWAATNLMARLGRENFEDITARLFKLATGSEPTTRRMALYCIRDLEIAGSELLAVVENAIHDSDVHVRLAALSVLSKVRDESGAAGRIMLERLKSDADAGVRRAAASALGNVSHFDANIVVALEAAASDTSDESLARAARGALNRIEKLRVEKH